MAHPRSNAWLTVAILVGTAAALLAIPTRAFAQSISRPGRSTDPGAPARSPLPVESDADGSLVYRLEPGLDYFLRIETDPTVTTIDTLKDDLRATGVTPVVTYERVADLDPRWPLELRAIPAAGTRWVGVRVATPTEIPADRFLTAWGT